jgi:8-oxo-dGTP diphosphatase
MLGLSGRPLSVKLGTGRWREIGHGEVVPVVYLVRHAHAGKKAQWQGPDQARPLSAQGRKEALGLLEQLRDLPVRRLLSSPAERCLQTVEPLADKLGQPIELREALGVHGTAAGVLELVTSPALDEAVLCTHGELIRGVFDALQAGAGIELSSPPQWPKGSTWVLRRDGRGTWKGTYLEPVVVEAEVGDTLPR